MSFDADKLVTAYIAIRDKRSELKQMYEDEDLNLEADMGKIEAALLEHCKEHNMESLKTASGTAYKRIRERYWATDWDAFNQYIREHDAIELYEKRIHQGNMKQFLEDHPGATPPINVDRKFTISVRRSK
jgi:hypothetical protein